MLHAITWKQFGIAAFSAGLLYYLIVLFKYYRQEAIALLSSRKNLPAVATPGTAAQKPDQGIFGAAQFDDSEMNLVDADELNFAEAEPDEIDLPDTKSQLLGEVADFMQELKVLLRITKEAGDTKENFLMLLRLLISKHPVVATATYAESIATSIIEDAAGLPFELALAELEQEFINPLFTEE
ncbi:hypothetical protein [Mucilaginibacter sp.]|jgi:hypothetical protein|uniref:hypothetical protein n=1 Tax=Mucilaginibacter sp. TaxID=1882438 RepID=UPI003561EB70